MDMKLIGSGYFGSVYLNEDGSTVKKMGKLSINELEIHKLLSDNFDFVPEYISSDKNEIVMEYVKGDDLNNFICYEEKPEIITQTMIKILDCVSKIHELGVTHGDLNSGNIMIDLDNNVKIIDFGLSTIWQDKQSPAFYYCRFMDLLITANEMDLLPESDSFLINYLQDLDGYSSKLLSIFEEYDNFAIMCLLDPDDEVFELFLDVINHAPDKVYQEFYAFLVSMILERGLSSEFI